VKSRAREHWSEHWGRVGLAAVDAKAAERGTGGQRRRRQLCWDIGRGRRWGWLAAWALFCVCCVGALCVRSCNGSGLVAVQRLGRQNAAQAADAEFSWVGVCMKNRDILQSTVEAVRF
jgi:hypothetical protein